MKPARTGGETIYTALLTANKEKNGRDNIRELNHFHGHLKDNSGRVDKVQLLALCRPDDRRFGICLQRDVARDGERDGVVKQSWLRGRLVWYAVGPRRGRGLVPGGLPHFPGGRWCLLGTILLLVLVLIPGIGTTQAGCAAVD